MVAVAMHRIVFFSACVASAREAHIRKRQRGDEHRAWQQVSPQASTPINVLGRTLLALQPGIRAQGSRTAVTYFPSVVSKVDNGQYRHAVKTRSSPRMQATGQKGEEVLVVNNLQASVAGSEILKGVNLTVKRGEVHAIMGPNGCGKSTLSKVLIGHPSYEVTGGSAAYRGENILEDSPEERTQKGMFLAFQYPVEIPGVSNADFLRLSANKRRVYQGKEEYDPIEFMGVIAEKMESLKIDPLFLSRDVNAGFSGGEKKRNEILQMAVLEPEVAILDEIDSGLDIDAMRQVAEGVNAYRKDDNAILLITHYQRLLDYIKPDFVHIMAKGQIVKSGGPELALELERDGYAFLDKV